MWIPKKNRTDIKDNLPPKSKAKIARICGCSRNHVFSVLEGDRKDHHGIIKEAEKIAMENVWKTKYCKFKSELN